MFDYVYTDHAQYTIKMYANSWRQNVCQCTFLLFLAMYANSSRSKCMPTAVRVHFSCTAVHVGRIRTSALLDINSLTGPHARHAIACLDSSVRARSARDCRLQLALYRRLEDAWNVCALPSATLQPTSSPRLRRVLAHERPSPPPARAREPVPDHARPRVRAGDTFRHPTS